MTQNYSSKKTTFFTFLIILLYLNTYSQCTEIASNFGNNTTTPSYNVSGDVSVTLNTDNTITLNLANNFRTASGPDVRAYLVNSNGRSDNAIKNSNIENLDNLQFSLIKASRAQSFTIDIPEDTDITTYDKILFYCLDFDVFWDLGSFSSFSTNSCAILSTEDTVVSTFEMYPNPATNFIALKNINIANTEIRIFDVTGKKVYQNIKGTHQENIDVSHLKSGIYVVSISEGSQQVSEKLMIQ